jgi:hypothetical protein
VAFDFAGGNGFLATSRATISRQPLLLDRSSGLHGLFDDRIGESVHFADRPGET